MVIVVVVVVCGRPAVYGVVYCGGCCCCCCCCCCGCCCLRLRLRVRLRLRYVYGTSAVRPRYPCGAPAVPLLCNCSVVVCSAIACGASVVNWLSAVDWLTGCP